MTALAHTIPDRTLADRRKWQFTIAAAATGARPVPAASIAITAETAVMVNAIAAAMGIPVDATTVVGSIGPAGIANLVGRNVFVEAARAIGWAAGPFGVAGVSALGAFTAALQTWILAEITIAICERGGELLPRAEARRVTASAKESFDWQAVQTEASRTR